MGFINHQMTVGRFLQTVGKCTCRIIRLRIFVSGVDALFLPSGAVVIELRSVYSFPLLDCAVEDGDDEDADEDDEHAAEAGNGHRNHDIASASGGGEDGDEREDGGGRGHQAGAHAPLRGFNRGFADGLNGAGFSFAEYLVEIGGLDDPVVGGDSEEGEEPDPDGDAEVDGMHLKEGAHFDPEEAEVEEPRLSVHPDQNEAAAPRHEDSRENQ